MRACHYRVESICRVLTAQGVQVAPRTYRNWKTARPSGRALTDAYLTDALRATVNTPEGMYGRRKMTAHLRRAGHRVAACTVDRLMRDEGMCGLVRGGKHRTTIPAGQGGRRAPDLLDRDFTAAAPNRKWVTDFTYCRTWSGFVYVAFVIDCFSRAIVGWHATQVKNTAMVTTALKMALWRRDHEGHQIGEGLIHHSDAGSQGGLNRSSQHPGIPEGARWDDVRNRRIGRYDRRCARRAGRCRRGMWSARSGA
jgi:putative transposase